MRCPLTHSKTKSSPKIFFHTLLRVEYFYQNGTENQRSVSTFSSLRLSRQRHSPQYPNKALKNQDISILRQSESHRFLAWLHRSRLPLIPRSVAHFRAWRQFREETLPCESRLEQGHPSPPMRSARAAVLTLKLSESSKRSCRVRPSLLRSRAHFQIFFVV